jgi:predicted O-linked N-acetylglucosamine transferase (SPINDLY family)
MGKTPSGSPHLAGASISPQAAALAHKDRGVALQRLRRFEEALACYELALECDPDLAAAHSNRGSVLRELKRYDAALESFARAIRIQPDFADAYNNRGNALLELESFEEAMRDYEKAMSLSPRFAGLFGLWFHARMWLCDWEGFGTHQAELIARILRSEPTSPFPVLAATDSPALQRRAAENWVQARHPPDASLGPIPHRDHPGRIRVGYYSADYHHHATAYLIAELIELHDRSRFEIVGFSFGPPRLDTMRTRLTRAFDEFREVGQDSDLDIARRSRELGIDIAVDLKGFTQAERAGIFASRAAPVQISYLGFPGSLGAPYFDYLVADRVLIPEELREQYPERIIYLPDSYQVNDRQRPIADRIYAREELGLPSSGFVYACFNANYKITPGTFDVWMRILLRTPGSVLWLLQDSVAAARNLRGEAERRGVDGGRLRFANRLPLADHLARQRAADLFLDTYPYTAHTTASDALWAGVPLITCLGETFAGRVAASLLAAVGLPELVTTTAAGFEQLAVELATDATRLASLRARLERNRARAPLFDTPRFVRHLESAYLEVHERCRQGELPRDTFVETT